MNSIFVRMAEGRDRGRKQEVECELAQSMIEGARAVQVDPRAPDFVPDFCLQVKPEVTPVSQDPEVKGPAKAKKR